MNHKTLKLVSALLCACLLLGGAGGIVFAASGGSGNAAPEAAAVAEDRSGTGIPTKDETELRNWQTPPSCPELKASAATMPPTTSAPALGTPRAGTSTIRERSTRSFRLPSLSPISWTVSRFPRRNSQERAAVSPFGLTLRTGNMRWWR